MWKCENNSAAISFLFCSNKNDSYYTNIGTDIYVWATLLKTLFHSIWAFWFQFIRVTATFFLQNFSRSSIFVHFFFLFLHVLTFAHHFIWFRVALSCFHRFFILFQILTSHWIRIGPKGKKAQQRYFFFFNFTLLVETFTKGK